MDGFWSEGEVRMWGRPMDFWPGLYLSVVVGKSSNSRSSLCRGARSFSKTVKANSKSVYFQFISPLIWRQEANGHSFSSQWTVGRFLKISRVDLAASHPWSNEHMIRISKSNDTHLSRITESSSHNAPRFVRNAFLFWNYGAWRALYMLSNGVT